MDDHRARRADSNRHRQRNYDSDNGDYNSDNAPHGSPNVGMHTSSIATATHTNTQKTRRDELQKLPPTALIVIRKTPRLRTPKLRTELLRFCCSVAQTSGRSDTIASGPS